MSLVIERISNRPIDSNCFIVYRSEQADCLIIDPGTYDCLELFQFIDDHNLRPEYIFLTHEHFDHIWGVNKLKDKYQCKIICSRDCADKIIDRKKNMSVFYDQIGFETYVADINIEDLNYTLNWSEFLIEFIDAKGHTDGSICILIGNNLFVGDTIILNTKTVTKFPSGNKNKLEKTFSLLKKRFLTRKLLIHSGHGESFWSDEVSNQLVI